MSTKIFKEECDQCGKVIESLSEIQVKANMKQHYFKHDNDDMKADLARKG